MPIRTPLKSSFAVNGQRFYIYEGGEGVLKLNKRMYPRKFVKGLQARIEKAPQKEISVDSLIPSEWPIRLNGIRTVQYLTKDEEYDGPRPPPRGLVQKLQSYFSH